jgi:hypothetical protein
MLDLNVPERDLPARGFERRMGHLIAEVSVRPKPTGRRRRLVAMAGLAALVVGTSTVFVGLGTRGDGTASAASVALREAAAAARSGPALPELRSGEYLYVKSVDAHLSTSVYRADLSYSVLVPHVREVWIGPDGGLVRERSGKAEFLTLADRDAWIDAGRPPLGEGRSEVRTGPQEPLDLPSDPDALFAHLERQAAGHSEGVPQEMFTLAGDALRETNATPEQRAALYEAVARIPGVELVGSVQDHAGRSGLAVAIRNSADGVRDTLIFDPETAQLLGEESVALVGNPFGYPPGKAVGYATYFGWTVVDALRERPPA